MLRLPRAAEAAQAISRLTFGSSGFARTVFSYANNRLTAVPDPVDEALFGCLMVAPSPERSWVWSKAVTVADSAVDFSWTAAMTSVFAAGGAGRSTKKTASSSASSEMDGRRCLHLRRLDGQRPRELLEAAKLEIGTGSSKVEGVGKLLADLLFDSKSSFGAGAAAFWGLVARCRVEINQ